MHRWVVLIVAAVAVVVLAVGAYALWPRGSSPVTEDEALERFRSQTTSGSSAVPAGSASRVPSPGVYRYTSSGEEVVKLGVLPSETRPYPDEMFVTIVDAGPSCFTATLNLLDQHTEDTTYCTGDAGGLSIESHEKRQTIGALRPTASMTCDPNQLVTPDGDGAGLTCALSLAGGPVELTAGVAGATQVSEATVDVGGPAVDAVVLDTTYEVSGDLTGTWHEKVWFAVDDWLPLRVERALDLDGLATFTERSALVLADPDPRR